MENETVSIPLTQLIPALSNALLVCTKGGGSQPFTGGIELSAYGKGLRIKCSDNYRLLIQDLPNVPYQLGHLFVTTQDVKTVLAAAKSMPKFSGSLALLNQIDDWTRIHIGQYIISLVEQEVNFPDFESVLGPPKVIQPEVINLDARFLCDAAKLMTIDAGAVSKPDRPPVVYNNYGNKHPSLFTIGENIQYFLMPKMPKKGPNIVV